MIEWAGMTYALAKEMYEYYKTAKEVFDVGVDLYDAGKGVKEHFTIKEIDPKLVDFQWPQKSGFGEDAKTKGYELAWSRLDKVASREIDGYEMMYEIDYNAKTRRKLVLYDGLVLLGKKIS